MLGRLVSAQDEEGNRCVCATVRVCVCVPDSSWEDRLVGLSGFIGCKSELTCAHGVRPTNIVILLPPLPPLLL